MFVNVGAYCSDKVRVPTKKALKEMLVADPSSVKFDCTAIDQQGRMIDGNAIPAGMTLVVVGPNPYTRRVWYANVFNKADGTLVVH